MNALSMSYTYGASDLPLIGQTIGQKFDQMCEKYGHNDAIYSLHQNQRIKYAELHTLVNAFACSLLKLGLAPGDRLGIWSPNCVEWTIAQFAAFKAGIILVNLNPAYKAYELEYVLNKVSCKGLIIASQFKSTNYIQTLQSLAPEIKDADDKILEAEKLPFLKHIIKIEDGELNGFTCFSSLLSNPSSAQLQALQTISEQLQFDDPINIQFTSGTTGNPKGTMLTHHNILNNAFFVGNRIQLTEHDKICIAVPLFHCFGMVMGNLACLTHGCTMVYPSAVFNPLDALKVIEQEKCTACYGVPTMFIAMLEHENFEQYDLSSLRTGIMAGSPCPKEIMQRVINRMHMHEVTIAYGMTETSPVSAQSYISDSIEHRVSTVGRVHPHLEIKIVDGDNKIVPIGERGELCVRGYSVMRGYWDEPEKTQEVIDEGRWMHTGDLASMDENAFIQITGRIKDMVIRGGENLFPKEIEDFLYKHPAVRDVQVVGLPDYKYGEELCACIILKEEHSEIDEQVIRQYCKENLSHNKIPKYIKFIESFPMTASGKAQKFKLKSMLIEELQLS